VRIPPPRPAVLNMPRQAKPETKWEGIKRGSLSQPKLTRQPQAGENK
jgi:hypothetical protein